MFGHTYNNVYLCSVKTLNRKMKRYRYIKSKAFTTGASLGNPAACVFMGEETLSPEQMQALGLKHGAIRQDLPIRIIDAGLRTLIVPITDLETEISVFPDEQELKIFCEGNDIDIILIFSKQTADTDAFAHTRVFAPKFGYLEDPATGSGNSAFANYLLSENLWNGAPITIEQGGNDRIFNSVKVKYSDGQVLFGGKSTIRIEGDYYICNNYDE